MDPFIVGTAVSIASGFFNRKKDSGSAELAKQMKAQNELQQKHNALMATHLTEQKRLANIQTWGVCATNVMSIFASAYQANRAYEDQAKARTDRSYFLNLLKNKGGVQLETFQE